MIKLKDEKKNSFKIKLKCRRLKKSKFLKFPMIRVGKELDMNEVCFEFMNIINDLITIIIKDFLQKRMNFSFIDDPEVTRIDDQQYVSIIFSFKSNCVGYIERSAIDCTHHNSY